MLISIKQPKMELELYLWRLNMDNLKLLNFWSKKVLRHITLIQLELITLQFSKLLDKMQFQYWKLFVIKRNILI